MPLQTLLAPYFDWIFILEVDKRLEEKEAAVQRSRGFIPVWMQLSQQERRWECVLCGDGTIFPRHVYDHIDTDAPENWQGTRQSFNYYQSLWKIIEKAKLSGFKNFLFLEDDAWFQPAFDETFPAAMSEIESLGLEWDMLYLGGNHHASKTKIASDHLLKCSCTLDMHAVAINHTMFDEILSLRDKDWLPENPNADVTIAHAFHPKKNVYCLWPSAVYQFPGFSHNEGKYLDRIRNWQHAGNLSI